ncbi:hypothetical protein MKZ38_008136 [Zalerion maritima]|uniref:Uncharacterized protein n=1 Tax=Zalerion maritima TaxID=339359 RepID=A0AAD5WNT8_9PEZI|nr:hypothetical protein MKZ38_008136 [Zalerion maritima]
MPSYFYHLKLEIYSSAHPQDYAPTAKGRSDDHAWQLEKPFTSSGRIPSPSSSPKAPRLSFAPCQDNALAGPSASHLATSERRDLLRTRATHFPSPTWSAGIGPDAASSDWRYSPLNIKSFDEVRDCAYPVADNQRAPTDKTMAEEGRNGLTGRRRPAPEVGPNLSRLGNATKARLVPLNIKDAHVGWGVVHLYREGDETPDLDRLEGGDEELDETQCTTLCIPAVPTEYDVLKFLDWIGPQWVPYVAHWRLVMANQWGSYIALLKFHDAKKAKLFREQSEGRLFPDVMKVAHVVYVHSVTFSSQGPTKFPDLTHDPFISSSLKPYPPPTADLIELPTCPVCLERMDDTTGLMTIHCQHIFHCSCLQRWKGSGCPVCRYSNNCAANAADPSSPVDPSNPYSQPFSHGADNMCCVCDCTDDLWICLICGKVGCGRYKGGHAKEHYKETAHCFSLELETQHVWDYAEDRWAHRLLRNKDDGKIMELPSRGASGQASGSQTQDSVPRSKMEAIGLEYSHLLSSQLDSQRIYFEEMLNKAVDKASQAAASAEHSNQEMKELRSKIACLQTDHDRLAKETVPQLERDLLRERKRAEKSAEIARNLTGALQEEKKVSEGLLERVKHTNNQVEELKSSVEKLNLEKSELGEMNRDLSMFISGQEKLKELEESGEIAEEEVKDGTLSAPQQQSESSSGRRRRRGKGRGG